MSNVLSTGDTRVFEIAKKAEIDEFDFDLLEVLRTTPTRDATEFLRGKLLDSGLRD